MTKTSELAKQGYAGVKMVLGGSQNAGSRGNKRGSSATHPTILAVSFYILLKTL
jgi:hypothetical protein